jgi:hypothetical protein
LFGVGNTYRSDIDFNGHLDRNFGGTSILFLKKTMNKSFHFLQKKKKKTEKNKIKYNKTKKKKK